MVKTYLKTFARMFKRHLTRLVSVFLMVLLAIGFSAGIGMATDKMRAAFDGVYVRRNVSDFIVRGAGDLSQKAEELEAYGYEVVAGGILETETDDGIVRIYTFPEGKMGLQNQLTIIDEAPMPEDAPLGSLPVCVERSTGQLKKYELGETVEIALYGFPLKFVVTKIVENPLHLAVRRDPSMTKAEDGENYLPLGAIFYLEGAPLPFPANNLYVSIPSLKERDLVDVIHTLFGSEYERTMKAAKEDVEEVFREELEEDEPTLAVLTLHENFTFESYYAFADKVEVIGYVLMAVFLAVTLLVVLSTMTRLLEEERGQIACLSTLGYSPARILMKYLLFALVGTVIGAAGGYLAALGLAYIIYIDFKWNYSMPPFPGSGSFVFFLIVASVIAVAALAATAIAGVKLTKMRPAELLRPKAPRPGKKVLLERIPFLWNRLSFKYKSTLRNVLRFKTRFAMTVVSVMASTALVVAGLAVLDCCIFQEIGTTAMIVVAVVVLVFAALLNAVVIYTLTNINISERERELATLMVLGYSDKEVSLYVYREIYITSAIGILLGIPFGAILCTFIFSLMVMGSLGAVTWYVWIVAPLMSLFFTFLVTLMLSRKIRRIHMNESLKAIE